jgi:hypothetical protein
MRLKTLNHPLERIKPEETLNIKSCEFGLDFSEKNGILSIDRKDEKRVHIKKAPEWVVWYSGHDMSLSDVQMNKLARKLGK